MTQIKQEKKEKYLENKGAQCPYCNSSNLTGNADFELDSLGDGEIHQTITCNSCHKQWTDIYSLTDVVENWR